MSTKPLERPNEEAERRTDVVGISGSLRQKALDLGASLEEGT